MLWFPYTPGNEGFVDQGVVKWDFYGPVKDKYSDYACPNLPTIFPQLTTNCSLFAVKGMKIQSPI